MDALMYRRGDTIIEVVMAVMVFSLVAVGAMTVMNNGLAMAQRSLETTLVRQQIDSQAEMLRFIHDKAKADKDATYTDLWDSLPKTTGEPTQIINSDECSDPPTGAFALVPSSSGIVETDNFNQPTTYARVVGDMAGAAESQGISIQIARVSGGRAYDAYIQACWYSLGTSHPMTVGTIVRIYDAEVL